MNLIEVFNPMDSLWQCCVLFTATFVFTVSSVFIDSLYLNFQLLISLSVVNSLFTA